MRQLIPSGVFISRWIPKILRGIRREFPSKLKGREGHSVTCFLPFRERYNFLFKDFLQNIFYRTSEIVFWHPTRQRPSCRSRCRLGGRSPPGRRRDYGSLPLPRRRGNADEGAHSEDLSC